MRDSCFVSIDRYWSPSILGPLKGNYEFLLAMFVFAFIGCFFYFPIYNNYIWWKTEIKIMTAVFMNALEIDKQRTVSLRIASAMQVQCWCRSGLWKMGNCRCKLYCRRSRDHYCLYLPRTCRWRKAIRNVGSKPASKQQQALKVIHGK